MWDADTGECDSTWIGHSGRFYFFILLKYQVPFANKACKSRTHFWIETKTRFQFFVLMNMICDKLSP